MDTTPKWVKYVVRLTEEERARLRTMGTSELLEARYQKFRRMGRLLTEPPAAGSQSSEIVQKSTG